MATTGSSLKTAQPVGYATSNAGLQRLSTLWHSVGLSPRKLHPVLRAERAKKDRFATGQKNYFFGCFMNVILDVVK